MSRARTVHVVVPDWIDDPRRPSGGNTYDRQLCRSLAGAGWTLHVHRVAGAWPRPSRADRRGLARTLAAVPAGAVVVVDGLVASAAPETLVPASRRLRVVVLLHLPLGAVGAVEMAAWLAARPPQPDRHAVLGERAVLAAAAAVVTTSGWSRRWLLAGYGLDPVRVAVARPGVDAAPPTDPEPAGVRLLCVGPVVPAKGHDVLAAALAPLRHLPWRCLCVGPLDRDPAFVRRLGELGRGTGLEGRLVLAGPRTGTALAAAYAAADLLVHPSRVETYGMVVTEALARALPVVAADAGGVGEALGTVAGGDRPGVLVTPGDVSSLGSALRRWLTDDQHRRTLRAAAAQRRVALDGWDRTAARVGRVLQEVAA